VTVCLQHRECLLGEVVGEKMLLNDAGWMVERWWNELANKFSKVEVDEHVVMPNHFHGIIIIVRATPVQAALVETAPVDAALRGCLNDTAAVEAAPVEAAPVEAALCGRLNQSGGQGHPHRGVPTGVPTVTPRTSAPTLGDIMDWFKTMTTNEYIRGVKGLGWPPFQCRFWQRNYYEHIIRNEGELERIREYIVNNPLRWHLDRQNPHRKGADDSDRWLAGTFPSIKAAR